MAESSSGGRPTLLVAIIGAATLVGVVSACDDACDEGYYHPRAGSSYCENIFDATDQAEQYERDRNAMQAESDYRTEQAKTNDDYHTEQVIWAETEIPWEKTWAADYETCGAAGTC